MCRGGVAGLEDRSHARKDGVRKVDLKAIAKLRDLQKNPEIGVFRVHAALKQLGISLSPRACGRILERNRKLYGLPKPQKGRKEPKPMPFTATRRHEYCLQKREIERRQPWQSYIETNFNVQRRMADSHFAQATTWEELLAVHDRWAVDFNYQSHWAHCDPQDDRRSPAEVLGWMHGVQFSPDDQL